MQTRNQAKHQKQSSGTLAEISQDGVNKLLRQVNPSGTAENGLKSNGKQGSSTSSKINVNLDAEIRGKDASGDTNWGRDVVGEICQQKLVRDEEGTDESDWEDGSISKNLYEELPRRIRKLLSLYIRFICYVCWPGRLIDSACSDPFIQAVLLSLLPSRLLQISEVPKLTVNVLAPLVTWFHNYFRVRSPSGGEVPFHSSLAVALETREGTLEEVVALSVALFRALNLTARFVSMMDVASLKPELEKPGLSNLDVRVERKDIFNSSTLMVTGPHQEGIISARSSLLSEENIHETSLACASEIESCNSSRKTNDKDFLSADQLKMPDLSASETRTCSEGANKPHRKGDLEFQMQLEMALSATSVGILKRNLDSDIDNSHSSPSKASAPLKRIRSENSTSSSQDLSIAVGSRKVGAPLYWAEVYCSGENMTGKWVHVDAVNFIIDGEDKVEAAALACKKSLRYVVAFAGNGAKDVTRRYCAKWYRISSKRVNSLWWDAVLAPLKELESGATGGVVLLDQHELDSTTVFEEVEQKKQDHLTQECKQGNAGLLEMLGTGANKGHGKRFATETTMRNNSAIASRSCLEDMELKTRALTEPLPSNQQAYRNHPLYAIAKWLTKYQILHPKGPVLGFCSGHPVYPRSCVQALHTKERWLHEGLQVRANELPAKVVASNAKQQKGQVALLENSAEVGSGRTVALYGKWQTEPLCLPHAVNGIVPKNERGQVDVWSEKCLPPGTVHLKLPRLVPVAKRLDIDFAPAMVGFDFQNGRSIPVYEGIVVCSEFKDAILEAYGEEEERREEEEKKRDEKQAISRWYQLLSSVVVRQRLNDSYGVSCSSQSNVNPQEQMICLVHTLTPARIKSILILSSRMSRKPSRASRQHTQRIMSTYI
ncbi:hypothetical protein Nepgr_007002 [Nepenthes gracilis]|uniref:DNA repair protein RAD4 n=1 Tax=Nepenthes gracilis TaxID=150966 RepID=A0AAD3S6W3_NEPGR|nr:hypothetical protein Nepgr_007002 [Nepenthes gracilis]